MSVSCRPILTDGLDVDANYHQHTRCVRAYKICYQMVSTGWSLLIRINAKEGRWHPILYATVKIYLPSTSSVLLNLIVCDSQFPRTMAGPVIIEAAAKHTATVRARTLCAL